MSDRQAQLLVIQAILAGLQVFNMGLIGLEGHKLLALVTSAVLASLQFYITHAANKTTNKQECPRCGKVTEAST